MTKMSGHQFRCFKDVKIANLLEKYHTAEIGLMDDTRLGGHTLKQKYLNAVKAMSLVKLKYNMYENVSMFEAVHLGTWFWKTLCGEMDSSMIISNHFWQMKLHTKFDGNGVPTIQVKIEHHKLPIQSKSTTAGSSKRYQELVNTQHVIFL